MKFRSNYNPKLKFLVNNRTSDGAFWIVRDGQRIWGIRPEWSSEKKVEEARRFKMYHSNWKTKNLICHPFYREYLR